MSKDMVKREGGGRGVTGLPFPNCMVTGSKQRLHRFQKLLLLSITIDSRNDVETSGSRTVNRGGKNTEEITQLRPANGLILLATQQADRKC